MRKILALLTVFVVAFVLVGCTSTNDMGDYVSPNKIVYDRSNSNEFSGGKPVINYENDLSYFSINYSQYMAKKASLGSNDVNVVAVDGSTSLFLVTVKNTFTYTVYVTDSTAPNPEDNVIAVLSPSAGHDIEKQESNVSKLFFTTIANPIDLNDINVLVVQYQDETQADVEVLPAATFLADGYDVDINLIHGARNVVFDYSSLNLETSDTIYNRTVKPAQDNNLPINFNMENTWVGYIWDWILIIPISFLMSLPGTLFGFNNFALGILIATLIVRSILWPIYAKTNDMSMKMALMQPDMNRVQAKYANRKDPASQQKMQMEIMGLYKKHGVSILGCFTPLIQMPIFFAMFQVLYRISVQGGAFVTQVSDKKLFWVIDLTAGGFADFWSYIFAAIVGVTMWLLQKLGTKKPSYAKNTGTQVKTEQQMQTERTMRMVSVMMIGMMVFTTLTSANAMGLYWVIGNAYAIGQQMLQRKIQENKYEKAKAAQSIV